LFGIGIAKVMKDEKLLPVSLLVLLVALSECNNTPSDSVTDSDSDSHERPIVGRMKAQLR
jgi:hypothetical protein